MTPTEKLRARVRQWVAHPCSTCGKQHGELTLREVADQSGVPASVTSRFLRGGSITSDTLDALTEWLERD